jgi:hypothetical protein
MSEKPLVNLRRFQPNKIPSKYWVKFFLYLLILGALVFWYKQRSNNTKELNQSIDQTQVDLKGVKIEE